MSSTTSAWAPPCVAWTSTSSCSKGLTCLFRHDGFPTHHPDGQVVNRCLTCGSADHTSWYCGAPGGWLDPNWEQHSTDYRERKAHAIRGNAAEGGEANPQPDNGQRKGKKGRGEVTGKSWTCLPAACPQTCLTEAGEHPASWLALQP